MVHQPVALAAAVGLVLGLAAALQAADDAAKTGGAAPVAGLEARKAGDALTLGGKAVTIKELDLTPLVRNEFSAAYKFDSFENPKLKTLREKYQLDKVVAPGKTEFDKQLLLMDWTYRQFKKFGTPSPDHVHGALEILAAVEQGGTYYCAQYASVLSSAAASLGWIDRTLGGHVCSKTSPGRDTYKEHSWTEIWSNQYKKWIMFDPTFDLYVEKNGVPLNSWEIRQEWFHNHDGQDLDFVVGPDWKKKKRSDMPWRPTPAATVGFSFPTSVRTFDVYGFIMYATNQCQMDPGPGNGPEFICKDSLCDGIEWHTRKNPADPAREANFPLNQAALTLTPADGPTIKVTVDTCTPNFANYKARVDGHAWQSAVPATWPLHAGTNTLEVVSVNKFGVEGVPSKVVLDVR